MSENVIPASLTARYTDGEDLNELLNKCGFQTFAQLKDHVESVLGDAAIPNVRYSYGVKPYPGDSEPDPRITIIDVYRDEILADMWKADRNARLYLHPGYAQKFLSASSLEKLANGETPQCMRTDNEERWRKRYENMEEREEKRLKSEDLKKATRALTCFNMKFQTDYVVEEILGSKVVCRRFLWHHCNFVARSKEGSQSYLFFAELRNSYHVTLCCIVDVVDGVRGCKICGEEFIHPAIAVNEVYRMVDEKRYSGPR